MDPLKLRALLLAAAVLPASAADLNLQMTDRFDPPTAASPASPANAREPGFGNSREQRAADHYRQAGEALVRGNRASAEQSLRGALDVRPDFHSARAALCALLYDQERYDEASGLTQEGLERAPQDAELRQIEARLLAQRGQLADAINLLRLNAPPLSAEPQYHALLASLHLKAGAGSAASGLYRALLVRDPQDADHWMGLAAGEDLSGNTEDARSAYRKAVDLGLNGALLNFAQTRLKDLGE